MDDDLVCFECHGKTPVNGWKTLDRRRFCSKICGQAHIDRLTSQDREIEFRYCADPFCEQKARYSKAAVWWCEEHSL